uniref:Uncharacterized protein n=1 Tax=Oryza nivara TaxID=4536 RepID=A0A0E0HZ31_ORYNI
MAARIRHGCGWRVRRFGASFLPRGSCTGGEMAATFAVVSLSSGSMEQRRASLETAAPSMPPSEFSIFIFFTGGRSGHRPLFPFSI